jgi:hypothetical protein
MIGDSITGAAVEQAMVSACGSCRKIKTLNDQNLQSSQRTITGSAGSCRTTSDYDDIIMFCLCIHGSLSCIYVCEI